MYLISQYLIEDFIFIKRCITFHFTFQWVLWSDGINGNICIYSQVELFIKLKCWNYDSIMKLDIHLLHILVLLPCWGFFTSNKTERNTYHETQILNTIIFRLRSAAASLINLCDFCRNQARICKNIWDIFRSVLHV